MAEKVEVRVDVDVEVDDKAPKKSIKNIEQELKEARDRAIELSREFGELSPQALEAAKRVTELKDEINDMNERASLFDPGQKFAVFGNVVNSIAGGFTAAQGAMALFGSESEDLQKQLVKLQGALALTQGLSTIADSAKDFQRLAVIVRTNVVSAFSTLRGAIISTGVGALVVGLGLLIANFDGVEKWLKKVIPGFESFGKALQKLKAVAAGVLDAIIEHFKVMGDILANLFRGDFSGAIDAAKNMGDRMGKAYNQGFEEAVAGQNREAAAKSLLALNEHLERELKLRKAKGLESAKQEEEIARNIAAAKLLEFGPDSKEYLDAQTDFNALVIANRKAAADKAAAEEKKAADAAKAAAAKAAAEQLKDLQNQHALEYQLQETLGKDMYGLKLRQLNEQKDLMLRLGLETKDIDFQIQTEILNNRKAINQALVDDVQARSYAITEILIKGAEAQQQLLQRQIEAQQEVNRKEQEAARIKQNAELAKQAALTSTSDLLGASAQLVGEQTAVGKGLAIAQTTISTYQGAQSAFSALAGIPIVGPALGAVAAAAAIVAGIARVKAITSTQVPGAASTGNSSISNVSAPVQPQPSLQSNVSTLIDQVQQQTSQGPQRVYVLESDITDTQDRVAKIEANAKF